ncbi:MAG: hypothetical protein ABIH21_01295 [Patescibacteria group bacterium]
MSKTPNFDLKIKPILDSLQPGERTCRFTGKKWFMSQEEISWYKKFNVPPSTIEPITRLNYLNAYNTGLAFFWKPNVKTGKPILSAVHPDSPIQVLPDTEWMSEEVLLKGKELDTETSIMDQLWQLTITTPFNACRNTNAQNSVAVGCLTGTTDSYIACASSVTRCYYAYAVGWSEDCVDIVNSMNSQRSYCISGSHNIADSQFIFESQACNNCSFLFDCWNCEYCFGATNKRNKKYLWFNEQLSEQDWKERYSKIDFSDHVVANEYLEQFYDLWNKDGIWYPFYGFGNDDSEGERVLNCTRCHECFWYANSTDCYQSRFSANSENNMSCCGSGWENSDYMCTGATKGVNNRFCLASVNMTNCEYCVNCFDCEFCFACNGLKKKRYCILNKQFGEKQYWEIIDQLKCKMLDDKEYGEYFPGKFCPCGFQFSMGELYFGYSQDDLKMFGALEFDPKRGQLLSPKGSEKSISSEQIPDKLDEINPDLFVGVPIYDKKIDRNYSVIKAEFEIYKNKRWPFPKKHFVTRLTNLIRHANSPLPIQYNCDSCQKEITTYKNFKFPERKIYCRECYLDYLEKHA